MPSSSENNPKRIQSLSSIQCRFMKLHILPCEGVTTYGCWGLVGCSKALFDEKFASQNSVSFCLVQFHILALNKDYLCCVFSYGIKVFLSVWAPKVCWVRVSHLVHHCHVPLLFCEVAPLFSNVDLVGLFTLNKEENLEPFNNGEVNFL